MKNTKLLTLINLQFLRDYYPNLNESKKVVKGHHKFLTVGFFLYNTQLKPDNLADYYGKTFLSRYFEIQKIYFQAKNEKKELSFWVLDRCSLAEISYLPEYTDPLISVVMGCIDTHDVDQCLVLGTKQDLKVVRSLTHPSVKLMFKLL